MNTPNNPSTTLSTSTLTALSTSTLTALSVNLTSLNLEDGQMVRLRLDGRIVAGVSGTVGSVPALVRQLLVLRPELVVAQAEVTTEIGALVVGQPESAACGAENAECGDFGELSRAVRNGECGEAL